MTFKEWLDTKLIHNWKTPWHLHSIQGLSFGVILSALATALALLYSSQDASEHAMLPQWVTYLVYLIIFLGCFIGRLWKQGNKDDDK